MTAKVQLPDYAQCLFTPGYRYRALYGGRGGAKSHSIAIALLARGAETPLRILCLREIMASIEGSVKLLLDDKIEAMGLRGFYDSTDREIVGANGTRFSFAGARTNPDKLKSLEGTDVCWLAEANRFSARSLELIIPTIRRPGSELIFDWNPERPDDPVDQLFRGPAGPPARSIVRQVSIADNPWAPTELLEEMERAKQRDPDLYAHVWLGAYREISEATVFRNWVVQDFVTPADARFYFGADWGFSQDPTTLIRLFIGRFEDGRAINDPKGNNLFVDFEAWKIGAPITATPALFESIPGSRKWPITADSSRPETIDFMTTAGFNISPALKGSGSVEDGVQFLKGFDIVVHPRCRHVAEELALYRYKTDPRTGDVLPVLVDKNNHCVDAMRYALESERRNRFSLNFISSGKRPIDRVDLDMWSGNFHRGGWAGYRL